jgi:hypothetical protein
MSNGEGNDSHIRQVAVCPKCGKPFFWVRKLRVQARALDCQPALAEQVLPQLDAKPDLPTRYRELLTELNEYGLTDIFIDTALVAKKEQLQEVLEQGATDWEDCNKTSAFPCPYCGTPLQFYVDFRLVGVVVAPDFQDKTKAASLRMNTERLAVVEECKQSGVMDAFTQAVQHQQPAREMPKNMERYLLQFLVDATRTIVPKFVLHFYRKQFAGNLEFWKARGIIMVVADGAIRAFFPQRAVNGKAKLYAPVRIAGAALAAETQSFDVWTKTRFGYVPKGSAIFLSELRKRSRGEFAQGLT